MPHSRIERFVLTDEEVNEARHNAIVWNWDLRAELGRTRELLTRPMERDFVVVAAPTLTPGVEVVVPSFFFDIYAAGPPRSIRILVLASVMAMVAVFKVQTGNLDDPMNAAGRFVDLAMDLLGGAAFAQMIDLLRNKDDS